jgi:YD repeat-containing protein
MTQCAPDFASLQCLTEAGNSLRTYGYNPAGGLGSVTRDNEAFAWTRHYGVNRTYTTNGLNQYTGTGGSTFTYDDNGNLTSDGARAYLYDIENRLVLTSTGASLSYGPLGRLTGIDRADVAPWQTDQSFAYDLLGHLTQASDAVFTKNFTYDSFGRLTGDGYVTIAYDSAGRRASLDYGYGLAVGYSYNAAGDMIQIRENPAGANVLLATYAYDDRGRRTSLTRGNGAVTNYGYDSVSRLTQIVHNFAGTSNDLTLDFGYNPAGQIASTTRSNDAYAWTDHYAVNRSYAADGLNRYTAFGSVTPAYDARGNMISAGSTTCTYEMWID